MWTVSLGLVLGGFSCCVSVGRVGRGAAVVVWPFRKAVNCPDCGDTTFFFFCHGVTPNREGAWRLLLKPNLLP